MRHFGLIGKSLGHSFSKKFFSAKFSAESISADYELIELDDISNIRSVVQERELSGFNVTIPYKESIIPYLDKLTTEAQEVGAVNCVVHKDGLLIGHNTDITGIEASLEWLNTDNATRAMILGSGGASKAVQYVLRKLNIAYTVVSRDESKGDTTYEKLSATDIANHNIIINTTPLGMSPKVEEAPEIDYSAIGSEHKAFDLVYNPPQTQFLQRCKERGASTMGGIMMLQTQAIASWHIWQRELGMAKSEKELN